MASVISALSLFILILANGCFTLPVVDEYFLSSTLSSLNDDLTTEILPKSSFVFNDETTVVPIIKPKSSLDDHVKFVVSSSTDEPLTSTIHESFTHKLDRDDLLFTTMESITQVSEIKPEILRVDSFKDESTTAELQVELTTDFIPSFTSTSSAVAPELYTSESSISISTLPSTTTSTSSTTDTTTTTEASTTTETSTTTEISTTTETSTTTSTTTTTETTIETSTTTEISTSTSTAVPLSKSTKKYTNLFIAQYHFDTAEADREQPKPTKTSLIFRILPDVFPTTTTKSLTESTDKLNEDSENAQADFSTPERFDIEPSDKSNEDSDKSEKDFSTANKSEVESTDKSREDSKESNVPTAEFDQEASKKLFNVPNDFMTLEENNDAVVSLLPDQSSKDTAEEQFKRKSLSQGQKSS